MKWYWIITIAGFGLFSIYYWRLKPVAEKKQVMESAPNNNVKAFLAAIRVGEGTAHASGYNTVYGGGGFANMFDHPAITGEWNGKVLPDNYCKGAGLNPGCKTTAAGAYQFTKTTWLRVKLKLDLQDFTPPSQDLAAIELIREKGALEDVIAGRIPEAVDKVKGVWASLPGSPYGQPTVKLTAFLNHYATNGGAQIA